MNSTANKVFNQKEHFFRFILSKLLDTLESRSKIMIINQVCIIKKSNCLDRYVIKRGEWVIT